MSVFYTFFNGIAAMSMELFKCHPNPNGKSTLYNQRDIICNEDDWNSVLGVAIASTMVYCVGALVLFGYIMIKAPEGFQEPRFQKRWKFLFIKYRPDVYWWSFIFLAKGVVLNFGFVVLNAGVEILCWVFIALLLYLVFVVKYKPWRHTVCNSMELLTNFSLITCAFIAVVWAKKDSSTERSMEVLAVIVSLSPFVCVIIFTMILLYPGKLRRMLAKEAHKTMVEDTWLQRHLVKDLMTVGAFLKSLDDTQLTEMLVRVSDFDKVCLQHTVTVCMTEGALPELRPRGGARVAVRGLSKSFSHSEEEGTNGDTTKKADKVQDSAPSVEQQDTLVTPYPVHVADPKKAAHVLYEMEPIDMSESFRNNPPGPSKLFHSAYDITVHGYVSMGGVTTPRDSVAALGMTPPGTPRSGGTPPNPRSPRQQSRIQ
jgi:hypothetical protein